MVMDVSVLRWVGIAIGGICILVSIWKLRSAADRRTNVWLLFTLGAGLVSVGTWPSVVNFPSDVAQLSPGNGGRLIFLLMVISTLLVGAILFERARHRRLQQRLDTWIRAQTVDYFVASCEDTIDRNAIFVVIPARNEARNLPAVLDDMPDRLLGRPVVVLVVDDASDDDTGSVVMAQGGLVARVAANVGGGSAIRVGFEIARRMGCDIVVTMDGDGQHRPEDIEKVAQPLIADEADFVIGSRTLGKQDATTFTRWVGLRLFNILIGLLIARRITDCASGFRAFRLSRYDVSRLQQPQYHTSEAIVEASKQRLRIIERPISVRARSSGNSRKGPDHIYAAQFLRALIKAWLR